MQQSSVPGLQLSTKLQLQLLPVSKLQASSVPVLQQSPVFEPIAAVPSPCSCGAAAVTNSSAAATYWAWVTVLCCWSRADLLCPLIQPLGRPPRPNLSVGLALGLWLCLRSSLSLSTLLNNEINECQIGTNSKVNVELALPLSQRVWSTGAVEKGAGNKCVPTTAYLGTERGGCLNLPLISFMAH